MIVMPLLGTDEELSWGPGGYPVPQHQDLQICSKDDHLDSVPNKLPRAPSNSDDFDEGDVASEMQDPWNEQRLPLYQ